MSRPTTAPPRSPSKLAAPSASLDDVLDQARWGDVLLFKCRMPHTAVIRTLTWTYYDHVAVVAADSHGNLLMLEACVLGVRAFPLEQRVREYAREFADVIAWLTTIANIHDVDLEAAIRNKYVQDGGPEGTK